MKHKIDFEEKEWQRPVFGKEKTEMESDRTDPILQYRL